jgi:septum formation protein
MIPATVHVVLGSRSPRRRELLRHIIPAEQIRVCPPLQAEEPGFAGMKTWAEIECRLREIARGKCEDVREQCRRQTVKNYPETTWVLAADTVIVAHPCDRPIVLGQPPEPDWRDTVRFWFQNYLLGKTHKAATAVCLANMSGRHMERVVVSEVTFSAESANLLEWYLDTEEPRGKAGGYGIQGAGSMFVSKLKGSLSNVIGLPLAEILEMFRDLKVDLR